MDLRLSGKTAVVTGATQGIGRAVAELLAAEGCHLHLAARTAADLESLAKRLRKRADRRVETHPLNLARTNDQEALAERTSTADILVNCAGNIPGGELDQLSDADWRAGWELKVFGYIHLTRLFYHAMKTRGHGVIVNVIGLAGVRPDYTYIAGTTGNAALTAFTQALGARSVDFGVRVVGVNPALTDTPRGRRILQAKATSHADNPDFADEFLADLPLGRMAKAAEVAALVAFLASDQATYVSGAVVDLDGGARARP